MAKASGEKSPRTPFKRLGTLVFRRKKVIVVAWILVLIALVPIIIQAGNVTSLQQGSASGNNLESVLASNLISSQFQRTVPNSTLLIVVSGANVSSPSTQVFVNNLLTTLRGDKEIVGLNESLDVYNRLYAALQGVNAGAYSARSNANLTASLLFGVPAAYVGYWEVAYSHTGNVTLSNSIAFDNASAAVGLCTKPPCPPGPLNNAQILLPIFNSTWTNSWTDQSTAGLNLTSRIAYSVNAADETFIGKVSQGSRPFFESVLHSFNVFDYLPGRGPNATQLSNFAERYVSNTTGYQLKFVQVAFSLGSSYDNATLRSLAGNIIWNPKAYALDPGLTSLLNSLVSPQKDTTLITLGLNRSSDQNLLAIRSDAQSAFGTQGPSAGIQSVQVTGQDAISYDFGNATQDDLGLILPVTIGLLIVATGLFFRSVLTPFITLGSIGVALGISQVFVVIVATYVAKVDFTIPTVLLTVLIGVGTDYSVFVIARYREERVKGASVQQSIETSVTWAGESIATSGATVIISFLALSLTSITFLKTMGFVVGLGVLVALSVALTLVPAIVGLSGGRTFWPTSGDRFTRYATSVLQKLEKKRGYFSRSGAFAVKHAKVLIVLAFVVSGPALYVYSNTTPTYDFLSAAPSSLESVGASNHLTTSFGAGTISPSYVVMTFVSPLVEGQVFNVTEMNTIESLSAHLAGLSDIKDVTSPTRPFQVTVPYQSLNLTSAADKRTDSAVLSNIGKDNKTALVTVNFGIDPYSTQAISDAAAIRQYLHANYSRGQGVAAAYVGGASGSILDTKEVFDSQFNSVVPIVAVGVALVLLAVLGSLFLPVFAVLSVLMSIVWTLAATRLVFQQFYNYQILFITPFFLFVTLLGLGMDYNVFILTRIREEATKGKVLDDAIVGAIEQTGGIITAAAIILAGSLGALMLSSDLLLKQLGFSFAYSILIDALVVRTYLVPAFMSTMKRWNWYSPIPYLNRSQSLFLRDSPDRTQS